MIPSADTRERFEREVVAVLPELLGTERRLAQELSGRRRSRRNVNDELDSHFVRAGVAPNR